MLQIAPGLLLGFMEAVVLTAISVAISTRLPMLANLVISNVPGPQVPLYMAGAKMLTFHQMSIVIHGVELNITIKTYAGSVDFGLIADKQALPQMHELTNALQDAFEAGRELLTPTEKVTRATQNKRSRAKSIPV